MNAPRNRPSTAFLREQSFWSLTQARQIVDLSGKDPDLFDIADAQLRSAVALQSILLRHGTAYLADEAGMGKTYIALALVALLRCYKPDLRVLYVTPSRNVREKWALRECQAMNVLLDKTQPGHRWAFSPRQADSIADWVKNHTPSSRDTFISFSAFSFQLDDDPTKWDKSLEGLIDEKAWRGATDKAKIKEQVALKVHEQVLKHGYDLLVFDEAHLLRSNSSDRARFIRLALRGPEKKESPVFRASLLLSATPFDRDLDQLRAQLKVAEPGACQLLNRFEGLKPLDAGDGTRDWSVVQEALRTFMVRRSHELVCADEVARSRNQYRVEHRAAAAISLRHEDSHETPKARAERLLQRLYTAVVQKKLVESKEAASFPLAMFSSWESYTLKRPQAVAEEQGGDVLDVKGDAKQGSAEVAKDSDILTELSESWCERFPREEPPHPKLEREAKRIADEAFDTGDKQLVFVRRIRSINDLKARIDRAYDNWLAQSLVEETGVAIGKWLEFRPKRDTRLVQLDVAALVGKGAASDPTPAASFQNLFCWFFRGENDAQGERLAAEAERPTPEALRTAMTTQTDWRSVLGETNWRMLLRDFLGDIGEHEHAELARIASEYRRVSRRTALDNFRYVQLAWLRMRTDALPEGKQKASCERLIQWIETSHPGDRERVIKDIDVVAASAALNAPTLMTGMAKRGLLDALWPSCKQLADSLRNGTAGDELFADFDLYREVLFGLVRLDHPFIDLWLSCDRARITDSRIAAQTLVDSFCNVLQKQRDDPTPSFSSYLVISQLAQGWKYLLKTNFADLKARRDASGQYHFGVDRHSWRGDIARRITARDPVEWASGQNAKSRPDIAWRFRMPGYPMVLVSTSVFQEGEDLHTFCRHVTHFGISGSPIGIEQKNGRVDRVGSQSQRLLTAAHTGPASTLIEERGISIRFPHLTESLEWLQIRDLAVRLNEYQRSLHRMSETRDLPAPSMREALRDSTDVPEQLTDKLCSPFEPRLADWQSDGVQKTCAGTADTR